MTPGLGTWPKNCLWWAAALGLVQTDHQSQLLQRQESPEGLQLSILPAATIAMPDRLTGVSTKR